jgi:hypothetical protein
VADPYRGIRTVKGKRELQARLHAISDLSDLLRTLQLETIAGAKARVPRKTGHLGRSILPGPVSDTQAVIEVRTPYAAAVEFGSKPHVIRPKRASVLAWPSSESGRRLSGRARTNAGDMTFARKVNHPGTKAQPFMIPAAKEALAKRGLVDAIVTRWNDAA